MPNEILLQNEWGYMDLDDIDYKILKSLHKNSRLSNKELAAICGLAPSSTLTRLRALTKAGVIKKFSVEIDQKYLGVNIEAMLSIIIQAHSNTVFNSFYEYLNSLEEVVCIYHTTGKVDLLVHVVVRDSDHLRNFVIENISSREEVNRCETALIYEQKRRDELSYFKS